MFNERDMHIQGPQINQFNNISPISIPRSTFIRDFTRRTTFDADYLVPIMIDEILPGDDLSVKLTAQVRMTTPLKPLMDNLYFESHWFFVPMRLVWSNWEKFQGQQTNPGDSVAYTIPVLDKTKAPMSTTGFVSQSVYDYFGLPTLVTNLSTISALFNRAYDLVYNEWYRDENLQNSIAVPMGDGPDDPAIYTLRKRNNRKDYFMSGLPWPQKGDAVTIPISGTAPIRGTGTSVAVYSTTDATKRNIQMLTSTGYLAPLGGGGTSTGDIRFSTVAGETGLEAVLSAASSVTINALRQAALYQQILELDARGGTRYVESIFSRFGVVSPDFRLQRPELIGQGHSRINVYAVPQTAPTGDDTTPQGNLAAYSATAIMGDHGCRYNATEHGILLAIGNVRADLTYQQGVPRMFRRQTRLDFYEPLLNGLGEQSVLKSELYAQGTSDDDEVLCYQERFSEYRFKNSEITGKFRSTDPQSLDIWHLSIEYGSEPSFNSAFITQNTPMDRILAVSDEPDFLADMFFNYQHTRPMPIRSNPGINRL